MEPTMRRILEIDNCSVYEAGIPGVWCVQAVGEYRQTHHSQSDTFDKVWKDDINQGAQVLAAWAYNTANLPDMLPRRPFTLPSAAPGTTKKEETPKTDPLRETDKKIIEQVKTDKERLKGDLTYLTSRIGPRLTGSAQMDQASHWTEEQFKALGLANVHREPWTIANNWTRGPASGRVTWPTAHELTLATAGWSPATNGTVKGPLIAIEATKPEDLEKYKGKLSGKIAMLKGATELEPPENPLLTPWGQGTLPLMHAKANEATEYRASGQVRTALMKMGADGEGVAVLTPSEKMTGLLNMSAMTRDYQTAAA